MPLNVPSCLLSSTAPANGGGFFRANRRWVLARLLREKLEAILPQHLGQLARLAGDLRQQVKDKFSTITLRRRFWERLFAHDRLAQSLANQDAEMVDKHLTDPFEQPLSSVAKWFLSALDQELQLILENTELDFLFNWSQNHCSEYAEKDTCHKGAQVNKK